MIATVDALFAIVITLVTAHVNPKAIEETLTILAIIQPVVIMWIKCIADEDVAACSGNF